MYIAYLLVAFCCAYDSSLLHNHVWTVALNPENCDEGMILSDITTILQSVSLSVMPRYLAKARYLDKIDKSLYFLCYHTGICIMNCFQIVYCGSSLENL